MTVRIRAAVGLVALLACSVWLRTTAQALRPGAGLRAILSDLTAPAIARGRRQNDPPSAPRTSGQTIVDRTTGRGMRAGSVIVKFRAGTASTAQRLMLSSVAATAAPALPYADFDIV